MFKRKRQKPDTNRLQIAKMLSDLDPGLGQRLTWGSPLIGRCAPKQLPDNPKLGSVFELIVGKPKNSQDGWPFDDYTLLGNGDVVGVTHSQVDVGIPNLEDVINDLEFQINSGLFVPNIKDELEVVRVLTNGMMDTARVD